MTGYEFTALGRALSAPARSAMVACLLDGGWHAAGELARTAGVSSSTASSHFAVLLESGMVEVRTQGRFRQYAIRDADVAAALETLSSDQPPSGSLRAVRERDRIRAARTCYDHLAGRLGVALSHALVERRWLTAEFADVTETGTTGLADLGIDIAALRSARRPLTRTCLDWTEREPHLGGGLGAALGTLALDRGWVQRIPDSRGVRVTPSGNDAFGNLGVAV